MKRPPAPTNAAAIPAETATADPAASVVTALRRISRASELHSRQLAKLSGLTVPQAVVLQAIRALGEVTTGRLAARVDLSQATLTVILDRLEQRGLIERYRSAADRRIVHARLTAAGSTLLQQAPPLLDTRFIDAFRALPVADQLGIVAVLNRIASMMGADRLGDLSLLGTEATDLPANGPKPAGR